MKINQKYLTTRGPAAALRFYFQPQTRHVAQGWRSTYRLHDEHGVPLRTIEAAIAACQACVAIYERWMAGDAAVGPGWLTELGQVRVPESRRRPRHGTSGTADDVLQQVYKPGTIGAVIQAYRASPAFDGLAVTTKAGYLRRLRLLCGTLGRQPWKLGTDDVTRRRAIAGEALELIRSKMKREGRCTTHDVAIVAGLALGASVRLFDRSSPNHVPDADNPFKKLGLENPEKHRDAWPHPAVFAFAAWLDARGYPSLGDLILFNYYLGQRHTDMLLMPASAFALDRPLDLTQSKTKRDIAIPWQDIPLLVTRFEESERRRAALFARAGQRCSPRARRIVVAPTTFIYNDDTGRPFDAFTTASACFYTRLRTAFAQEHPTFPARQRVNHFATNPRLFDSRRLQLGALRHSALTAYGEAGCGPFHLAAISGHKLKKELGALAGYVQSNEANAAQAIAMRLAYERQRAAASPVRRAA